MGTPACHRFRQKLVQIGPKPCEKLIWVFFMNLYTKLIWGSNYLGSWLVVKPCFVWENVLHQLWLIPVPLPSLSLTSTCLHYQGRNKRGKAGWWMVPHLQYMASDAVHSAEVPRSIWGPVIQDCALIFFSWASEAGEKWTWTTQVPITDIKFENYIIGWSCANEQYHTGFTPVSGFPLALFKCMYFEQEWE
jgi:hypothetical protein